ncbi:yrdC domain-containing protein, mitochondrial [Calypte anna]|uniref:yrdC domain-containing protein, mitochondrial n=1 Tax=Calypte anna TaxID=9244 RepID=UPI0011C3FBDF|nr:yrdC domain-containing protein, mitochondrial [Calypte anna]
MLGTVQIKVGQGEVPGCVPGPVLTRYHPLRPLRCPALSHHLWARSFGPGLRSLRSRSPFAAAGSGGVAGDRVLSRSGSQRGLQGGHLGPQLLAGGDAGPQAPLSGFQQLPQAPRVGRYRRAGGRDPRGVFPLSDHREPGPGPPRRLHPSPGRHGNGGAPDVGHGGGTEAAGAGEGAALAGLCEAGDRAPGTAPGLGQARSSRLLLPARTEPPGWQEAVSAAARALQAGGLVAVPTDTVYGVACLAQDSGAVRSIYSLKGRNGRKPLAICVGDVERLFRYCRVEVPEELLHDLLPGPVTLVLQRSEELNKELNPFTSLVGVRVPNHPFIRELARACSGPLALTSANISSQGSTLSVTEFQELWPQLSLIIDGGPLGDLQSPESRLGSTVVDLSVPGKFSIIRPGCALASTVEILRQKYGLIPASS